MPKEKGLPTKTQVANFWMRDYASTGHCVLCGNHGIIDTRGKVFTAAGYECGDRVFCICPNGQIMRKHTNNNVQILR
jgi:hypothetical protein